MNNPETSQVETSNFIIVGFGFIVLWSGFVCFVALNIVSMLAVSVNSSILSTAPTTLNITRFESRLASERTQSTEVDKPLEITFLDENLSSKYFDEEDVISSLPITRKVDDIVNVKSSNDDVDDMIFGSTVTVPSER